MRSSAALIALVVAGSIASSASSCSPDAPVKVKLCSPGSRVAQVEVWHDQAVLIPRPSIELLPLELRHGIQPTMSRVEIEKLLAPYLESRKANRSEFVTPLGRLNWSLDREVSGGYEARVTRVYFYPDRLSLGDFLDTGSLQCLREAGPDVSYVVLIRGDVHEQLATLRVEGLTVRRIVLSQRAEERTSVPE